MIKKEKRLLIPLNRLFFRILSYFLSLLLPIAIIGTVFYFYTTSRLKENDTQKIMMNLQSSAETIEAYLRTTEETSAGFFYESRALLRPYDEYSQEERVQIPRIPESIAVKSNILGSLVDKMFVFADTQKVYTAEGLNDFDLFFRNYSFQNYDQAYWEQKPANGKLFEILDASEVKLNNWQKKTVIPFVFTNTVNGHKAVVVITVSTNTILKTIRDRSVVDSTDFIVTDNNDHVIVSSAASFSEPDTIQRINQFFNSGSTANGELKIGHANSVVTHVKSETYGWNYYSVTPVAEFQKQTRYFIVSITAICLTLVLIGIMFSFIFTFNLYSPIKRIRDILDQPSEPADETAKETRKNNEFVDIGIRINRLIEHNHKFKHELATISAEYLERSLMNLFHGSITVSAEQEIGKMLRNHLSFQKPFFLCCNIWFEFKEAFYNDIQDVDRMYILGKMKKIIWGLLRHDADVYLLEETDNLYICIINLQDEEEMLQVRKALQNIIDTFRYDSRYCMICIGIGKRYEGVQSIAKSYNSAMNALESADQKADFQIVDAAQLPPAVMHYLYSFMDENAVINCLKAGDSNNLRLKIEEIVNKNKEKGIPRHLISALMSEMYNTGSRFLVERGMSPLEIKDNESIDHSAGYEKQKLQLLKFFDGIIACTSIPGQQRSDEIVSVIIKYIEENYHHDLGLENIADGMGVSAKYASRVFKEKTGDNLIGYISSYRIAKAKELLLETDLNVNEIAERVGIYSRTTFIRLFKKYEGTTPHLYRNFIRGQSRAQNR